MANEIEIRVTGTNTSSPVFEQVRRQVHETGRATLETSRHTRKLGDDTDHTGHAMGRMAGLLSKVGDGFATAGSKAGEMAMSITGKSGPYGALAMLGAVLTALPVAAQAAGAGITLGVGAGLAGLGMMVAAKNAEVQASFKQLKSDVMGELSDMAKPFEGTLLEISKVARDTFDRLAPDIEKAFERIAPKVTDFARKAGEAFTNFGPMIDRLSVSFGPLLDVLGDRLPDITKTLADAFTKIGEAADPRALNMLIDGFNALVVVGAEVIRFFEVQGAVMGAVWEKAKELGGAIKDVFTSDTVDTTGQLGAALADVGMAAADAGSGVTMLTDAMAQLAGEELTARDAMRNLEEAIDAATDSVSKNGRTLNINTKAGRTNQQALDNIAKSALEMRDAMEKSGQDSSKAMSRARSSFISSARSMNMSKAEAEKLADRLGLVTQKANKIPRSKQITLKDNAAAVKHGVDLLIASINSVPRRRETTFVQRIIQIGQDLARDVTGRAHGGIVGAAGGGPRSNLTLVGEQGPELVALPPGSMVHTAGATRSMLSGGTAAAADRIVLEIHTGGTRLDDLLVEILQKAVRVRGGNVQLVLGKG